VGVVDGSIQEEIRCYVMRSMNVGQSTFSPVHSVLVAPSTKGTLTVTLLPNTGTTCLSATSGDRVIVLLWLPVHIVLLWLPVHIFAHLFLCCEGYTNSVHSFCYFLQILIFHVRFCV